MNADRREAGNATLEYVGMTAVAVALVLALLMGAGAIGVDILGGFKRAICNALDLACGGTPEAKSPAEQCVVATNLMAGDGSVDVAVVTLGGGASLLLTRLADGTYEVTLYNEDKAQASTGVGAGVHVDTGKGTIGYGASASVAGGLAFGEGMKWTGLTKEQGEDIIDDLKPAVTSAPAGPFKNILRDVREFLDGDDSLRQPDVVYVEGGLAIDASAEASFGAVGGSASAKANAYLGYSEDRVKDQRTVYIKAGGGLDGSAGVLFGPAASAGIGLDGVIGIVVDSDNNPVALEFEGTVTAELAGQLGSYDGKASDDVFAEIAREYGGGDTGAGGETMTQVKMTLDLTDDRNAAAAVALLGEAGVTLATDRPLLNPGTVSAGAQLARQINETGFITVVDYDVDSSKYGAKAQAKAGLQLGAQTGMSWTAATARRARQWTDGRFVDLPNCVA